MTKDNCHAILFSMKNNILIKTIILIGLGLILTGCKEEEIPWEPVTSEFTFDGQATAEGITVGSSFTDFASAYAKYPLQILDDNSSWKEYSLPDLEENPDEASPSMTLMTSYFFVDGTATDTASLIEMTGVPAEELSAYISSKAFLDSHDVVFHYMIFEFQNGNITSIDSDYLNYDSELFLN